MERLIFLVTFPIQTNVLKICFFPICLWGKRNITSIRMHPIWILQQEIWILLREKILVCLKIIYWRMCLMNGNQNMVCIRSISMFLQPQKLWTNCRTMKLTASFRKKTTVGKNRRFRRLQVLERQKSISL